MGVLWHFHYEVKPSIPTHDADVYVYDRPTHTYELISVDSNGNKGNAGSYFSEISDDGRYVTFYSNATNLILGDRNSKSDVFIRDRGFGRPWSIFDSD